MSKTKLTAFEKKCQQAADDLDIPVMFFEDDRPKDQFEDDGNLHIIGGQGLRACFDVGQCQVLEGADQNKRTLAVLDRLGLKVTDDVLVSEAEDQDEDDDYCDHCGRGGCG